MLRDMIGQSQCLNGECSLSVDVCRIHYGLNVLVGLLPHKEKTFDTCPDMACCCCH